MLGKIESVNSAALVGSSLGAFRKCLRVLIADLRMVVENLKEVYFEMIGRRTWTISG